MSYQNKVFMLISANLFFSSDFSLGLLISNSKESQIFKWRNLSAGGLLCSGLLLVTFTRLWKTLREKWNFGFLYVIGSFYSDCSGNLWVEVLGFEHIMFKAFSLGTPKINLVSNISVYCCATMNNLCILLSSPRVADDELDVFGATVKQN